MKPLQRLVARMGHYARQGRNQSQPDWLARFVLRPEYEEPELPSAQRWLYDQGIRNYLSGLQWLQQWNADNQPDLPIYITGTRDLCWQISWLLEILEGRYANDIADSCAPDYYLNSRYGCALYWDMADSA